MSKHCRGWDIQAFCCFASYSQAEGFPFWCDVHGCEAWDCFTDLPPPGGRICDDHKEGVDERWMWRCW